MPVLAFLNARDLPQKTVQGINAIFCCVCFVSLKQSSRSLAKFGRTLVKGDPRKR